MVFENPHVSVERAWYDTPGGRTNRAVDGGASEGRRGGRARA
jgi:hypothetical protein